MTTEPENAAEAPAAKAEQTELTLRTAVVAAVAAVGPRTRELVIEHFAKAEAEKQAGALIKGLDKLNELQRERGRIRPTTSAFDIDGKAIGEPSFTKEQVENHKKLGEQIAKLTKAMNKADENGDFADLYNLVK